MGSGPCGNEGQVTSGPAAREVGQVLARVRAKFTQSALIIMGDQIMIRFTAGTATIVPLTMLLLSACVPAQQYNALENDYNQLNQQLSGEIASQQVHITRLQGAIKVAVNSELLFPSGGWEMPLRRPRRSPKWLRSWRPSSRPR